jgi:hypothetical protein
MHFSTFCFALSVQVVDKSYEILEPTTQTWTPYTNYTQPPPWSTQDTYISEQTPQTTPTLKTPTKRITTYNAQFEHFTTLDDTTLISSPQSFMTTHNIPPQNTNTQSLQNTNTEGLNSTNTFPLQDTVTQSVQNTNTLPLQNTVTQPVQTTRTLPLQDTVTQSENIAMMSPQSTTLTMMSPQSTLPATPRRSPRKHASTPQDTDSHVSLVAQNANRYHQQRLF